MNPTHLPRSLVILLFILVAGTFFMGILRAFVPARAALAPDGLAQKAELPPSTSTADFPTPGTTPTPLPASLLPPPTDEASFMPTSAPTLIPTPISHTIYADTTGVIALAILLVIIVLVGTILGERKPRQKKEFKK